MPDLALDLRYLRYAILVAEQGSVRRAAEILNLSQSTLSRRIQLLERRLGVVLFERSRTGVRPTGAGERFFKEATIGARYLQDAVNNLSSLRRGEVGALRIGLMVSLGSGFLADLLETYRCRFPDVDVTVEENTSQASAAGVLNGHLDAAFIPGAVGLPGCEAEPLWDEEIYVAFPLRHPLLSRDSIAWADIQHEIFLITTDAAGPEIGDYLMRQLSAHSFRPTISVQGVGRENLLNMVAKGFGLTLTTSSTLGVAYSGVGFVPLAADDHTVSSSVVWSTSNSNPALKKLLQLAGELSRTTCLGRKYIP